MRAPAVTLPKHCVVLDADVCKGEGVSNIRTKADNKEGVRTTGIKFFICYNYNGLHITGKKRKGKVTYVSNRLLWLKVG